MYIKDIMAAINTKTFTWKCKCGKFQVKLLGDPLYSMNCHCHSCTAASRHITDKYPDGQTQLSDTDNRTGSAMSIWNMKDIVFFQGSPLENLGHVKIGENGQALRSYTKCCGTQAFLTGNEMPVSVRHFNRNCLYNEDGTKYEPKDVPNIMTAYAFVDPLRIPEPRYRYGPIGLFSIMIPSMIRTKLGLVDNGKLVDEPTMWVKSKDVDEIVPITW